MIMWTILTVTSFTGFCCRQRRSCVDTRWTSGCASSHLTHIEKCESFTMQRDGWFICHLFVVFIPVLILITQHKVRISHFLFTASAVTWSRTFFSTAWSQCLQLHIYKITHNAPLCYCTLAAGQSIQKRQWTEQYRQCGSQVEDVHNTRHLCSLSNITTSLLPKGCQVHLCGCRLALEG